MSAHRERAEVDGASLRCDRRPSMILIIHPLIAKELGMFTTACRSAIAAFALSIPTTAHAAPKAAFNKSVFVSWVGYQPGIGDGGGKTSPATSTVDIYISSQGRLFVKAGRSSGRRSQNRELDPAGSNFAFAGNTIVGTRSGQNTNGATRITITFDASFQSCTATVVVGTPGGATRTWRSLRGERMTATGPPQISGINCRISEGNSFAG